MNYSAAEMLVMKGNILECELNDIIIGNLISTT